MQCMFFLYSLICQACAKTWTGLWTMDCGLWTMDCGLWTVDYGLWTVGKKPGGGGVDPSLS